MTREGGRARATVQVIRPAALLPEQAARDILAGLAADDVGAGGRWRARPGVWQRFDQPWPPGRTAGEAPGEGHLGTISCIYDSPRRYTVTIFRASVTAVGAEQGWTVESLCDDALRYAGLTLASCPRVPLDDAPRPFTA